MKIFVSVFGLVFVVVLNVVGCSDGDGTAPVESAKTDVASRFSADIALEKQKPPEGWASYSDDEFGVSWHSPVEPKATRKPGDPPTVIYDMFDSSVAYMLTCIETNTRKDGSPDAFLDGLDEGTIGGMRRNGLAPKLVPLGSVSYGSLIGRKTRIDMAGSRRQGLKYDLTAPDACFSLMVVGEDLQQLQESLDRMVTSIELSD